jgi:hypothetical protein
MPVILHQLPAVITHTYHPGRGAFRNICCLPRAEAEHIISAIRNEGFSILKADYLQRRMRAEAWLVAERTRKLGVTPLVRPIYFFLGDMTDGWDKSRPAAIVLPLADFSADMLTFTFPDSMTSCPELRGSDDSAHPCHGQVFTFTEMAEMVSRHGFPDPRLPREQRGPDAFIEVQLWDDRPLEHYRP